MQEFFNTEIVAIPVLLQLSTYNSCQLGERAESVESSPLALFLCSHPYSSSFSFLPTPLFVIQTFLTPFHFFLYPVQHIAELHPIEVPDQTRRQTDIFGHLRFQNERGISKKVMTSRSARTSDNLLLTRRRKAPFPL